MARQGYGREPGHTNKRTVDGINRCRRAGLARLRMTIPATERRTDYRLTFLVLCVGVASFSLLQSMVNPVLPTIQAALAHRPGDGHLGAHGVPRLRLDLHPDHRPRRRQGRQGADAGRRARRARGRLAARRRRRQHRRADRRPRDPGHRRRRAAADVRHHPRRVPAREGRRRHRHGGRAARRRRRRRPGDRRAARRGAELPLALLDPDGDDHRGRDRRGRLGPRVPRAHARQDQRRHGVPDVGLAGRAAGRREPGPPLGLVVGQGGRALRGRRDPAAGLGASPRPAARSRWSTCR